MVIQHSHHLLYMYSDIYIVCTFPCIDLCLSFMFEIEHLCSYRLLCCIILLELLYVLLEVCIKVVCCQMGL